MTTPLSHWATQLKNMEQAHQRLLEAEGDVEIAKREVTRAEVAVANARREFFKTRNAFRDDFPTVFEDEPETEGSTRVHD